jgi:prepilin-type N-terminal cleavage/methylation domain-containing protein
MKKNSEGFTLLELLIVITIIAILSVALVFVLNPSETLAKSRDTRRMADLTTLKTALGIYMTSTSTPTLDGTSVASPNDKCLGGVGTKTVFLSIDTGTAGGSITQTVYPTGFTAFSQTATASSSAQINGAGWIPVKLSALIGGSPISSMPVDPVNKITTALNAPTNAVLMYRYACRKTPSLGFEIASHLESSAYGVGGTDDKSAKDGGLNNNLYEVGTDMTILPNVNTF